LGGLSRQRVPHRAAITVAVAAGVMVIPGRLSWALALSGASILVYYSVAHVASFTLPGPWVLRRLVPIVGLALAWVVIAALLLTLLTSVSPA
jgi:APA family basic amino acid/polyamine antiporter